MSDDTKRGPTYAGTGAELPAIVCNEGHTNALAELALRNMVITMTAKGFF